MEIGEMITYIEDFIQHNYLNYIDIHQLDTFPIIITLVKYLRDIVEYIDDYFRFRVDQVEPSPF